MKREQQVCSLELAKWLKKFEVKQESLFWWTTNNLNLADDKCVWWLEPTVDSYERRISAFTVAELGEMLPINLMYGDDHELWFDTRKNNTGNWMVCYEDDEEVLAEHADTEAEARAKMLVYLLEHKLITL